MPVFLTGLALTGPNISYCTVAVGVPHAEDLRNDRPGTARKVEKKKDGKEGKGEREDRKDSQDRRGQAKGKVRKERKTGRTEGGRQK